GTVAPHGDVFSTGDEEEAILAAVKRVLPSRHNDSRFKDDLLAIDCQHDGLQNPVSSHIRYNDALGAGIDRPLERACRVDRIETVIKRIDNLRSRFRMNFL